MGCGKRPRICGVNELTKLSIFKLWTCCVDIWKVSSWMHCTVLVGVDHFILYKHHGHANIHKMHNVYKCTCTGCSCYLLLRLFAMQKGQFRWEVQCLFHTADVWWIAFVECQWRQQWTPPVQDIKHQWCHSVGLVNGICDQFRPYTMQFITSKF